MSTSWYRPILKTETIHEIKQVMDAHGERDKFTELLACLGDRWEPVFHVWSGGVGEGVQVSVEREYQPDEWLLSEYGDMKRAKEVMALQGKGKAGEDEST